MEEVARVAVPARRGRGDIALGNIVGTVAHFVAFNAAVIALVRPLELDGVSRALHLPVAVASAIVLAAILEKRGASAASRASRYSQRMAHTSRRRSPPRR